MSCWRSLQSSNCIVKALNMKSEWTAVSQFVLEWQMATGGDFLFPVGGLIDTDQHSTSIWQVSTGDTLSRRRQLIRLYAGRHGDLHSDMATSRQSVLQSSAGQPWYKCEIENEMRDARIFCAILLLHQSRCSRAHSSSRCFTFLCVCILFG